MRKLVLGYDGVDYELVKEYGFSNILQEEHGRVKVPLTKAPTMFSGGVTLEVPWSPVVWSAFITGREEAYDKLMGRNFLFKIGRWLRLHDFNAFMEVWKALRKPRRLGTETYQDKRLRTIFDLPKSVGISVPTYNEFGIMKKLGQDLEKVIDGKTPFEAYYKTSFQVFMAKASIVDAFLSALPNSWQLLMVHFQFADLIGHLRRGYPEVMEMTYEHLDRFAKQVRNKLDENDLLLIVADHGMRPFGRKQIYGVHSKHGFYSSNKPLHLNNPSITSFYKILTS